MVEHADLKGGGGDGGGDAVNWQIGRWKAEILQHPLYEQLLSAHVSCLRIATPVDQLPRIDAQLAQSQNVVAKYAVFGHNNIVADDKELDQFMVYNNQLSIFFLLSIFLLFIRQLMILVVFCFVS